MHQGPKRIGLRLTFEDRGPGIPDIDLALRDGYTTGNGLGLGLNGARKLSHEFDIQSAARRGHARHDHALEVTCRASSSPNRARSRMHGARWRRLRRARASTRRTPGAPTLVAMEICSNLVKHGGGGELIAQPLERGDVRGVGLLGLDKGPGIADLAKCLRDGFSTGGSPGTGLGAINRMAQLFDVYSQPGHGTAVLAQLWPDSRAPREAALEIGAIVVPKPGEVECGDTWCYVERAGGALVMGVDGLGHGLGAAQAASMACEVFMTEKTRAPAAVLERVHANLRTTRGAAAIVIEIDWDQGRLLAAGIGNMVAAIIEGNSVKRIPSYNGIVGHATPRIRELSYPHLARGGGGISFGRADHQLAARTLSGPDATPLRHDRRSAVS